MLTTILRRVPGPALATRSACAVTRMFLIGSLMALAGVVVYLSGSGQAASLLAAQDGAGTLQAFGLSYEGAGGIVLAGVQAAIVGSAWLCTRSSRGGTRKLGLATIMAWAGLWLANALWLAGASDNVWRDLAAWIMLAVFASTGIRAIKDWPRRSPEPSSQERTPGPRWTHRRERRVIEPETAPQTA